MIDVADEGRVRYLTLNRPAQLNALNTSVLTDLTDLVRQSDRDRVGCLVIRGAGDKAFCAGADLDEIAPLDVAESAMPSSAAVTRRWTPSSTRRCRSSRRWTGTRSAGASSSCSPATSSSHPRPPASDCRRPRSDASPASAVPSG